MARKFTTSLARRIAIKLQSSPTPIVDMLDQLALAADWLAQKEARAVGGLLRAQSPEQFVRVLQETWQAHLAPEVLDWFLSVAVLTRWDRGSRFLRVVREQLALTAGHRDIWVYAMQPGSAAQQEQIVQRLRRRFGWKSVRLDWVTEPAILSGIRCSSAYWEYDASGSGAVQRFIHAMNA